MKVGIMQPYFFPYIGYFSLIKNCDEYIVFDTPQFMRKGWIERNRIIRRSGGSSYIKVPLIKAPVSTAINEMKINNDSLWKDKILAQLNVYKNKAPYYRIVLDIVKESLDGDFTHIADLNVNILKIVCSYLGIKTKISVYSCMDLQISPPKVADEWALNICQALGASSYINAEGGKNFFDRMKYTRNNVDLCFIKQGVSEYKQLGGKFEPNLSIIDVMMFNSTLKIQKLLDDVSLLNE